MKLILFMLMSVVVSCSQSNQNEAPVLEQGPVVQEAAPSIYNISQTADGMSGTLVNESEVNFGDVLPGASVTKNVKIFASTNITGLDVSTFAGTNFIQTRTNCGTSLTRNYSCMVYFKFTAPAQEGPISESLILNGNTIPFSANVLPAPAPVNPFTFTPNPVDLGQFTGTRLTKTVNIYNTTLIAQDTTMVLPADPRFTITHNCPNPLLSRKTCSLTVKFTTTEKPTQDVPVQVEASVQGYPITIKTLIKGKPRSEDPKFYFNPKPLNFGTVNVPGPVVKKTTLLYNYLPSTQSNLVPNQLPSWLTLRQNCSSVTYNRSCSFEFTLNPEGQYGPLSFDFEMGNDQYFAKLTIQANISGTQPCNLTNASLGGVTIDKVTTVSGVVPNCLVTGCETYYNISANQKSCDPVITPCTTLDATANGVNFANSNSTITGDVVGGNTSQCLLATNACNVNYVRNTSGKSCDGEIRACTQADAVANGVNISNVNLSLTPPFVGQVNTGDVSQCLINDCITGYTKDASSKTCVVNERDCVAADITSIGGNPANALTYSGKVLLGDASACKIATCSGTYEPAVNGLSCENFAMSNLSFVISNKNANGYVKDNFLQINSTTINALEMKISDNATCSGGTWEPFVASKQFSVPATRLNVLADAPVSIQYKRNANISSCIYVATGGLTSATSHLYRHDNIAPVVSITSHTENQDITVNSLTFSGACTSGINRETGLFSETLQSGACSGSYTSQTISTVADGIYKLYVKQVDLAGNIGEVTRTVRKITSCNSTNATSGGVRSIYGALGYSGNLTDGCLITSCNSFTTIAADSKECVPKDITGGSFLISKNTNGYINTSNVSLYSISATNAVNFDIFENNDCSGSAKVSNVNYTTSTTYTPSSSVYNNASDQYVSLLFKNGSKTKCVHTAGAFSVASASAYRHDNIASTVQVTMTTSLVSNGGTITDPAITSVTFTGLCDAAVPLMVGLSGAETSTACISGSYSKTISSTFGSDGTYSFRAYQTDSADNTSQATYTIYRDVRRTLSISKSGAGTGVVTSNVGGINCGFSCSASYSPSSVITLTATPDSVSSNFGGWTVTGASSTTCSGTTSPCTVTIGSSNVTVTANFTLKPTYLLTVTKSGTGTGAVSSSPSGINCGSDCTENYYQNQSITLTAVADANSVFTGWSNGCTGTSSTCIVSMTAAKTATASFRLKVNYTVTVTKSGGGSGVVSSSPSGINCGATCSYSFLEGTVISVTSTPDQFSINGVWGGSCSGILDNDSCEILVDANKTITKSYSPKPISPTDPGVIITSDMNGYVYAIGGKTKTRLDTVGGLFYNRLTSTEISNGYFWSDNYKVSNDEFIIHKRTVNGMYGANSYIYLVNASTNTFTPLNNGSYIYGYHNGVNETGNYIYFHFEQGSSSGGNPYKYIYYFNKVTKVYGLATSGYGSYTCRKTGNNGAMWCVSPGVLDQSSGYGFYVKDGVYYSGTVLYPTKYAGIGYHSLVGDINHVYNDKMYIMSRFGEGKVLNNDGTFSTFTLSDMTSSSSSTILMYKNYLLYWAGSVLKARNLDNGADVKTVYSGTGTPGYLGLKKNHKLDLLRGVVGSTEFAITNATAGLSSGTFSIVTTAGYYDTQIQNACELYKIGWDFSNCWQYRYTMYGGQSALVDSEGLLSLNPALQSEPQDTPANPSATNPNHVVLYFAPTTTTTTYYPHAILASYNESTKKLDLVVRGVPIQPMVTPGNKPANNDQ